MRRVFLFIAFVCGIYMENHAANILFADPVIKVLCVAQWDTNGDGELSEEEASAVVSLGTVFRQKTEINSFHELRFFTGLKRIDDYAFYQSGLSEVTLPMSINEIGKYAFSETALGEKLIVPGNVKTIDEYAFYGCYNMKRVVLEEGVERIESYAFRGPLSSISLPASLTYLGYQVVRVTGGTVNGNFVLPEGILYVFAHSRIPASIHTNAFYALFGDGMLIVPHGSKGDYKAKYSWNRFIGIYEYGDVNQDGVVNVTDVVALVEYILGNKPKHFNVYIADVNGDGTINISDVIGIIDIILSD